MFWRLILHGKDRSGMHSHWKEIGFTWLWWIQGAISATLTAVGVDKIKKNLSNEALMAGHSIPLPRWHPLVCKGVWEVSG
jgi:hypothetical protein